MAEIYTLPSQARRARSRQRPSSDRPRAEVLELSPVRPIKKAPTDTPVDRALNELLCITYRQALLLESLMVHLGEASHG